MRAFDTIFGACLGFITGTVFMLLLQFLEKPTPKPYNAELPYNATWCEYLRYDFDSDSFRCSDKNGNGIITQKQWNTHE